MATLRFGHYHIFGTTYNAWLVEKGLYYQLKHIDPEHDELVRVKRSELPMHVQLHAVPEPDEVEAYWIVQHIDRVFEINEKAPNDDIVLARPDLGSSVHWLSVEEFRLWTGFYPIVGPVLWRDVPTKTAFETIAGMLIACRFERVHKESMAEDGPYAGAVTLLRVYASECPATMTYVDIFGQRSEYNEESMRSAGQCQWSFDKSGRFVNLEVAG